MALHSPTWDLLRVRSRSAVVWIVGVTLCTTVLLMLNISGIARSQRQQLPSRLAGWLQAAQQHVQTLRRSGQPPRPTTDTAHFSGSLAPPTAAADIPKPPLYPAGFQLSNLDNFTFAINNDVCGDAAVDAVMVVTSNTRRPSVRAAIRDVLPSSVLAELRMRRVFLLAELAPPPNASSYDRRVAALQAENHEHGDLVAGRFRDAYHNLTYKHLMGLHWAATYCPQAQHIIKMDDDVAVDVFRWHALLVTAPRRHTVIGLVFSGTAPIRDPSNKWYVSRHEYAPDAYPDYMSGSLYAITPDAAARLVTAAARVPFLWVDDAFVTGVVRDWAVPELDMLEFDRLWGRPDDTGRSASLLTLDDACLYECVAEPEAPMSQCDTLHGLVWDNLLVMRLFMKQAEYCHRQRRCGRRRRMPAVCHVRTKRRRGMPHQPRDIGDVVS